MDPMWLFTIELIRAVGAVVLIGCVISALLLMRADHEEGDERTDE